MFLKVSNFLYFSGFTNIGHINVLIIKTRIKTMDNHNKLNSLSSVICGLATFSATKCAYIVNI